MAHIDEAWPLIRYDLDRVVAMGWGHYRPEDVRRRIETTEWQLWLAFDKGEYMGFVVTEIRIWPASKSLEAVLLAGRDADRLIEETSDRLEEFGRAHGCVEMEMRGRFGWKRVLERHGWTVGDVIGRKTL